jgi:hypothetical protein
MEEQASTPIEHTSAMPAPVAVAARPRSERRRGGFFSRFFAAILVIVITTFLVLVTVAITLLYAGYTPDTPRQLDLAQAQLATLQAQSVALQAQNSAVQTEVASQGQRSDTDHETLGELKAQLANLAELRSQLRQEREQSASQNATLVAEARASRDAVALFATAEADRAALLADLDRRSARVERFLQRLSDISSDTALDLGAATEPALLPPAPGASTTISELSPTPTALPTSTEIPTEPPTPTVADTASPRPPTATRRPTRAATAIPTEASTPTLGR